MKVGFTGTRNGMSDLQKAKVNEFLVNNVFQIEEVAHGDCVGSDEQFHSMCYKLGIKIVIHPPTNLRNRAYCTSPHILEPKEYLARNCDIVNSSTVLIATPKLLQEEQRSGTWHAIRYALGKIPVNVFYINGEIIYNLSKV
jgi:hypothetical protein